MNIKIVNDSIWSVYDSLPIESLNSIYLAHCISADKALVAGIAVEFNRRFNIRDRLPTKLSYPECVLVGNVFNLVTKNKRYNKPTLNNLGIALNKMNEQCISNNVKILFMPCHRL